MKTKITRELSRGMREFREDMTDRARFYSGEITGPYSKGTITGKLKTAIQSTPVNKTQQSWSFTVFINRSIAPYGPLQEKGVDNSSFTGWRPFRGRGMVRVKKPPFHSGFEGKRFMARTARDARREIPKYMGRKVKISIYGG